MPETVGSDEELAFVHAFIEQDRPERTGLVLEGEAGIGKSTLWLAGVERARTRLFRVLSARPAEAERGLAHVGLLDLFEGVDDVLPALAPPRRRALEIALLREYGEAVVVVVKSGTVTFTNEDCTVETYNPGDAYVDQGVGHVHIARNDGTEPVVLWNATFIPGPPGTQPSRLDAPDPGCPS